MQKEKVNTFNLKLRESVRKKFKAIAHNHGISMQAILSAFIESYIANPDKYKIKMEVTGMSLRNTNMVAKPVEYNIVKLDKIEIREVLDVNGSKGEYHIRSNGNIKDDHLINYIRGGLPGCDVGLVDPTGELKLDYPIFLIVKDPMQKESMSEFFEGFDMAMV